MFGRRAAEIDALSALVRDCLDAQSEQVRVLRDAVASLTTAIAARDEESRILHSLAAAHIDGLRQQHDVERSDLDNVLARVADTYARLAERVDADRIERQALLHAFTHPSERGNGAPKRERVVGGKVFARDQPELSLDERPADASDERFEIGDAVSCRFGEQWIDGMQIVDAIDDNAGRLYRIRRSADDYTPPVAFRAADLRPSEQHRFSNETAAGRWARS